MTEIKKYTFVKNTERRINKKKMNYINRYNHENYIEYGIRFRKRKKDNEDYDENKLIDYVNNKPNLNRYIRELIIQDMQKANNKGEL